MILDPERLHVIRCYDRLPPSPGGMERHIVELTAAQRQLGVRVTEVFNSGEPTGEAVQLWAGRRLDQVRPYLLRSALFYSAAARSRFNHSGDQFTVIHVHGDWPSFLFGSMFGRSVGAHLVAASLHSTRHASLSRYGWALQRCDPIFTTGATQARELSEALGRRVFYLPSAPAELFFGAPSSSSRTIDVVAVGSLLPVKNMDLLLDCAARRRNLSFAIVGDGPRANALQGRAAHLGLDNVNFLGALAREQVRSVLHSARVFMNTSLTEGSPTAALEAMACGLPVVLTPTNDYSDIVDQGVNGRVTGGWDVDELVIAVDEFLQHPERLDRAARIARATAERHRWPSKAKMVTEAMIDALMRTGKVR